ncbi:TetR/AcrR family transcriptional regulator [Rhodococcus ruber]|uniref:TetR family transcriptional regulator n=1 Tax=Rhodococcus ruber BKS 20-38 TaxID=1278076 RepID=M2YSA3_9NOCA|nr:TetR/AcrR family transcriptional regulator [Rhodococcus ruber]EME64820.1 TetR family transcriptional regulator [Rhodococcus ruber BKS 20-38]
MTTDHDALPVDEAVRAVRTSSRRKQVLDAAVTVMQRTGFHQMSMQALADEAGVSVGLIYKYFGGKEDVLLATILAILDAFRDQLEPAMDAVGDDPIERLVAGMRRYIEIVDENLDATVLTYRESRTLDAAGRARIKELEVESSAPLRAALDAGIEAGVMNPVDVDLMVFDIMLLAHGWALKHWHFGAIYSLDDYIRLQTRFVLNTLLPAERRDDYAHLLG